MCGAKGEAVKKAVYSSANEWGKKRTSVGCTADDFGRDRWG